MDAPPDCEDTEPFIQIAAQLTQLGVHAPSVHAHDSNQGFLLLEDLGSRTYLDELSSNPAELYPLAINALIKLQKGSENNKQFVPPKYHQESLTKEMDLFDEWFINKHLKAKTNSNSSNSLAATKVFLVAECLAQPQVWVHRDYHSRNLMITALESPGVIDFQDLVNGPIGYDLASLFKDCYIEWPRETQLQWLAEYHRLAIRELAVNTFSFEQLIRWYDMAGLQRHLKVLGIFCRLNYRDGKANYMNDLPLVAKYTLEVIDLYPELADFKTHFSSAIRSVL